MILKNKSAVITGCNRGIGKSILEVFSSNGANIFACVRKIDSELENFTNKLSHQSKNKIMLVEIDFSSSDSIKNCCEKINNYKIPIDILVNNAGIVDTSLFQMTKISDLKKIFEINFFAQTSFTQNILKQMMRNTKGSIIYISSTSALDNPTGRNAYSASKAALISQALTLSKEIGKKNIRVNVIAPGLTNTKMATENTKKEIIHQVINSQSLNKIAEPTDIANAALFLSSDLSSHITGQVLRVDGGM